MVNEFEDRILFADGDEDKSDDENLDDEDKDESEDDESDDDSDDADDSDKDESKDDKDAEKKEDKKDSEKKPETPEAKRARLKRQLAQHEKKHGFKAEEPKKKKEKSDNLSSMDTIALVNAKVHQDDIPEVIEYAKFKNISIADALKSSVIIASLAEKVEQRATAEATNTGKNRPANAKVTGEILLQKAKKTGEIPDSDDALDKMLDSRYEGKSKKK